MIDSCIGLEARKQWLVSDSIAAWHQRAVGFVSEHVASVLPARAAYYSPVWR